MHLLLTGHRRTGGDPGQATQSAPLTTGRRR